MFKMILHTSGSFVLVQLFLLSLSGSDIMLHLHFYHLNKPQYIYTLFPNLKLLLFGKILAKIYSNIYQNDIKQC